MSPSFNILYHSINRSVINNGNNNIEFRLKYVILHAEMNGGKLSLYLKKVVDKPCEAHLLDANYELVEIITLNESERLLKFDLKNPERVERVVIKHKDEQVSNLCLTHDAAG